MNLQVYRNSQARYHVTVSEGQVQIREGQVQIREGQVQIREGQVQIRKGRATPYQRTPIVCQIRFSNPEYAAKWARDIFRGPGGLEALKDAVHDWRLEMNKNFKRGGRT